MGINEKRKDIPQSTVGTINNPTKKIQQSGNRSLNIADTKSLTPQDYDLMLDEYDICIDELIKSHKKVSIGDQNAISEHPKMLEKADNLQEIILDAKSKNSLTIYQTSRLTVIQSKMLKEIK